MKLRKIKISFEKHKMNKIKQGWAELIDRYK